MTDSTHSSKNKNKNRNKHVTNDDTDKVNKNQADTSATDKLPEPIVVDAKPKTMTSGVSESGSEIKNTKDAVTESALKNSINHDSIQTPLAANKPTSDTRFTEKTAKIQTIQEKMPETQNNSEQTIAKKKAAEKSMSEQQSAQQQSAQKKSTPPPTNNTVPPGNNMSSANISSSKNSLLLSGLAVLISLGVGLAHITMLAIKAIRNQMRRNMPSNWKAN